MPQLCVMPGDGIGKEVIPAAVDVLQAVVPDLETIPAEAGWACFEKNGVSVPQDTLDTITACGAALFGAVSSPSRKVEGYRSAILTLRQALALYANLRPVRSLPHISPAQGIDFVVVRENTEGMYIGVEYLPLRLNVENPVIWWTVILMVYCYVASVLPVWVLLQPRDYINCHQLVVALALLVAGGVCRGALVAGGARAVRSPHCRLKLTWRIACTGAGGGGRADPARCSSHPGPASMRRDRGGTRGR